MTEEDALTIDALKVMWSTLQKMKQPEYVVLLNKKDPLIEQVERLGYKYMLFDEGTLPELEENEIWVIEEKYTRLPTREETLERLRELAMRSKFRW